MWIWYEELFFGISRRVNPEKKITSNMISIYIKSSIPNSFLVFNKFHIHNMLITNAFKLCFYTIKLIFDSIRLAWFGINTAHHCIIGLRYCFEVLSFIFLTSVVLNKGKQHAINFMRSKRLSWFTFIRKAQSLI